MALQGSRVGERTLARVLRVFSDVRAGEVKTALLMTLTVFLLLTAYYLLKVAREPLILVGGGAELKSYASAGQALLLIGVVRAYDAVARRVGRMQLIGSVLLFFVANLVVFWLLGRAGVPLGLPFFLWVGIFNVTLVAQFWSFANDIYTPEQGARLFAIIGVGSSVGAVVGARLAGALIGRLGPYALMPIAAGLLLVCLGLFLLVHRRETCCSHGHAGTVAVPRDVPLGKQGGGGMVLRDRYLLLVAALVLLLNWVNTTGEYVLDRTLLGVAGDAAAAEGLSVDRYVGVFKARYFAWVNLLGVLLQLFVVSRVIRYAGIPRSLRVLPLVALCGYGLMAFAPLLSLIFVAKVAENSLDYSLNNTVRHSLFLVTDREAKYKAKTFIDTLVQRLGDVLAAACVWLGTTLAVGSTAFALLNVGLVGVWLAVAFAIGRRFEGRAAPTPGAAPADAVMAAKAGA
jgi:ATP:ADP antiporter, AAA family